MSCSLWEAVSWTRDDAKELRDRVEEVDDLWDEEEKEGLAKVTKDPYHSKCHASKVAKGVAHKYTRRIPDRIREGQQQVEDKDGQEGYQQ